MTLKAIKEKVSTTFHHLQSRTVSRDMSVYDALESRLEAYVLKSDWLVREAWVLARLFFSDPLNWDVEPNQDFFRKILTLADPDTDKEGGRQLVHVQIPWTVRLRDCFESRMLPVRSATYPNGQFGYKKEESSSPKSGEGRKELGKAMSTAFRSHIVNHFVDMVGKLAHRKLLESNPRPSKIPKAWLLVRYVSDGELPNRFPEGCKSPLESMRKEIQDCREVADAKNTYQHLKKLVLYKTSFFFKLYFPYLTALRRPGDGSFRMKPLPTSAGWVPHSVPLSMKAFAEVVGSKKLFGIAPHNLVVKVSDTKQKGAAQETVAVARGGKSGKPRKKQEEYVTSMSFRDFYFDKVMDGRDGAIHQAKRRKLTTHARSVCPTNFSTDGVSFTSSYVAGKFSKR